MGEVKSNIVDLRRRLRETRTRPWLTNSALRRSTASPPSGLNGSEDAPSLPASTTVTIVSDQPPSATGKCDPEEQRRDSTTKERVHSCLSKAKAAGSRIPQWVGLGGVLSRICQPRPLAREGELGKDKSTAVSPTVTEERTLASRLPVRIRKIFTRRRSASAQIRPSGSPGAHAGKPIDKGVGTFVVTVAFRPKDTAKPKQSRQKPEPIKSHRSERKPTPILKHRVELSVEAKLALPTDAGEGVKADAVRKVRFSDAPPSFFSIPKDQLSCRVNKCCGKEECRRCPQDRGKHFTGQAWLDAQAVLGYDYLKHSGGLWGGVRHELDTMEDLFF